MRYTPLLLSLLSSLAVAQNPFTMSSLTSITAGTPYNITWAPSNTDPVTLYLKQGNPNALNSIATIASSIPNSGSYLWTPSPSLVAGSGYAFEIVDSNNANINNYAGPFSIISTNTVSASSSGTASASGSTSATSGSSSASTSGITILTGTLSGTTTGSASNTGSASSGSSATSKASSESTASKTSSGASTGTSTTAPSATGNAATAVKAGGALLGLVGVVMAAL